MRRLLVAAILLAEILLASILAPSTAAAIPPPPDLFPEAQRDGSSEAGHLSESEARDALSDRALIRWAIDELRRARRQRSARRRPPSLLDRAPEPPPAYHDGELGPLYRAPGEGGGGGPRRSDVLRLFGEAGGGLLGFGLGAGAGALLAWGILELSDDPALELVAYGAGAILGGFGVSLGISLAGEALGGLGELGHAFVGQALGALVALPLAVYGVEEGLLEVALTALAILPLAGGMLGYEIAHLNRALGVGIRGSAYLSPLPGGALAGLRGTFS